MTEIEKLRQQKKELEQRIRELSCKETTCGRAKYGTEHFTMGRPDRHYIKIRSEWTNAALRNSRWLSIFSAESKQDAVEKIPGIIRDLQELYEEMMGKTE